MSRADFLHILTHILWFITAYAACMASHPTASFFNWACLSNGLIAAGATATGSLLTPNNSKDNNAHEQNNS